MKSKENRAHRPIRSYVRREGRITHRQRQALSLYWSEYGVEPEGQIDFACLFSQPAPVVLEIGFGMGDALLAMADEQRDHNFLGIEVHRPGVGSLIAAAKRKGLNNIKVATMDAKEFLLQHVANLSLDKVMILFPDPWHKKKHHKRRLIGTEMLQLIVGKMKPSGSLHIATDWEPYAIQIKNALLVLKMNKSTEEWINLPAQNPYRKTTKFEQRGRKLGHTITDLLYKKE